MKKSPRSASTRVESAAPALSCQWCVWCTSCRDFWFPSMTQPSISGRALFGVWGFGLWVVEDTVRGMGCFSLEVHHDDHDSRQVGSPEEGSTTHPKSPKLCAGNPRRDSQASEAKAPNFMFARVETETQGGIPRSLLGSLLPKLRARGQCMQPLPLPRQGRRWIISPRHGVNRFGILGWGLGASAGQLLAG